MTVVSTNSNIETEGATIGLVTIGQTPRSDVTPDIVAHLPEDVTINEVGALDGFDSVDDVEASLGPQAENPVFVTRLRDGSSVTVDRRGVQERLQQCVQDITDDVTAVGVLCTGDFSDLEASVPILEPSRLLHAWVDGVVTPDDVVGIVMPKEEQLDQTLTKWSDGNYEVRTAAGSPYASGDEIAAAADKLGTKVDLVVLDCIGYDKQMKQTIRERTGAGTLLGRSVLAKTMTEIL
jgi:protein AroM